ncbi:hypothetical protein [Pseudoalteromonas peptidolytica]|uniref:Uncharacterized protein n=2 Tax=Pseudoalteromonas peptidolytica TaxID=61150 RepID=A0A8I0MSK8_9GAMM|nr:hypothetical protein [Pseudoalteromonas peptidolytica]MBE0344961.1 hypothetical protein [Pseudoalteromonas peptidolytica F12-50-A1]GEK08316.1 hypothetical protein PPE03_05650 [Pseudoalteromonas peptidolytica]
MEMDFEFTFSEVENLIVGFSEFVEQDYDLHEVLLEYDSLAEFDDRELFELIKSDADFYNKIKELYKIQNGLL